MYTMRRDIRCKGSSGTLFTRRTQEAEEEIEVSISIPASMDAQPIAFAVAKDLLKGFFMVADGDLEVYTNIDDPGTDAFHLQANEPIHFLDGGDPAETNPFSEDVTELFVDNDSVTDAVQFDIRCIVDPTPPE